LPAHELDEAPEHERPVSHIVCDRKPMMRPAPHAAQIHARGITPLPRASARKPDSNPA
jgi:hypothetical protein